jgi:hypothetical protein
MMDFQALAISVAVLLIAWGAIVLIGRRWAIFRARRWAGRIVRATLLNGPSEPAKLLPESRYIVELSDSGVTCSRPDNTVESVAWDDLQSVEVVNTDEGPFAPDVFWVLHGSHGGCAIPQGATGERQLLERLQELPGFDNEALITAMGVTTNQRTLCWQRSTSSV